MVRFLVVLFVLAFATPSWAVFAPVTSSIQTDRSTVIVYEATWSSSLTGVDTALDTSACENIEYQFDPAQGGTGTAATFALYSCQSSTYSAASCDQLATVTNTASKSEWQGAKHVRRYTYLDALTTADSGYTASFKIRCTVKNGVATVPSNSSKSTGYNPGGLANQDCRDTDGVCPNPAGALVIDPWIGWVKSPGQRRDDNSSMWSTVNGIGSQTADAATDFINQSNVFTITGAGGSQYATTVDLAGNTNGPDKYFCRCSTPNYLPADTDGSCSTNGSGTSTVQPSASHYEAIVFKHGSRYYFASVTAYNGCNANPSTITLGSRLPVAIATGDSFQYAMPDGIHPDTYYYRWLAQNILEARWEATYWPKVNLLGGDEIKTGVTQNAMGESCSNWTKNSGSAGVITAGSFNSTPAGGGFLNAVRGGSCYLSTARAAGDSIRTPAATVEPGKVYAFHGWVRMNSGNGGDTNTVRVRPFNASGDTILGSTEFKTFWINGYDAPPVQWSSTGDSGHEVCAEWCFVVVLVKPATATSIYIDINGQTSTANLMGDEWVGFPSIYGSLDLHYAFPDSGNQSFWIDTDSRGIDANAAGGERLAKALDTMKASLRPLMTVAAPFASSQTATSGLSLTNEVASGLVPFYTNRPQYGLIHLGVNDAGNYSSANLVSASDLTVKAGAVPVILLEGPYRGDTTDTTACGSNCTSGVIVPQEKTFLQNGNAN